MSKQFLAVLAAIVIVFVGIFALSGGNKTSDNSSKTSSKGTPTEHIQGKGETGVILVEYGDYQCPYCQQYYQTVKDVQAQFNNEIKFQFRNYPLTNLHPNAFAAARAAEAAAEQDKFWEMHDALYENVNWQAWTNAKDPLPYFNQFAADLKLDSARFKKDFASSKVNNRINADMAAGAKLDITGTPSFFLNGKKTEIGNSVASFEKVIKEAIDKKAQAAN